MRLVDAQGKSIKRWRDWTRPKKESQWRSGRSAMELARAWFTSAEPAIPAVLRELLDGHHLTKGLRIESPCPEKVTPLPERGEGRNHDLVLQGRAGGRRVTICVEAKVDEEFGPMVGSYYDAKIGTRSRAPQRIDTLCRLLFRDRASGDREPWRSLRYQLVTGAAGSVLEADRAGADLAVFVVHEFLTDRADRRKKVPRNQADYEAFVRVLAGSRVGAVRSGQFYGPVICCTLTGAKINLLVGQVVDDWAA